MFLQRVKTICILTAHFQAQDKVAQKRKSRTRNMFHHYKLTGFLFAPHEFTLTTALQALFLSSRPCKVMNYWALEPSIINTLPAARERTAEGRIVWTFDWECNEKLTVNVKHIIDTAQNSTEKRMRSSRLFPFYCLLIALSSAQQGLAKSRWEQVS